MFKNFILLAGLVLASSAYAHDHHTDAFCSDDSMTVCAHVGYDGEFEAKGPSEFVFHVMADNADMINNLSIYLWMPDGDHGTQAVTIEKLGPGKYLVKDAYFSVPGIWEVRAEFDLGLFHQIIIPVEVK